ncbi:MAG: hypothetical protein US69_C0002G0004 [candidate division TM6 bacterium GW2011_GWF2_38_10]|nr:MAG: hypothetical protein US69_C0002G0004 [candidate division TM6 bacterium GW2011_GWF2_38_10]
MVTKKKLTTLLHKALHEGWSDKKLALSVAIGLFVAFSPFPGVHTILMFLFKWLFQLNLPILFLATSINNPWTMVPFYSLDYAVGYWVMHHVFGFGPLWNISFERIFVSGSICVWSFLVGGCLLSIFFAGIGYIIARILFRRVALGAQRSKDVL